MFNINKPVSQKKPSLVKGTPKKGKFEVDAKEFIKELKRNNYYKVHHTGFNRKTEKIIILFSNDTYDDLGHYLGKEEYTVVLKTYIPFSDKKYTIDLNEGFELKTEKIKPQSLYTPLTDKEVWHSMNCYLNEIGKEIKG